MVPRSQSESNTQANAEVEVTQRIAHPDLLAAVRGGAFSPEPYQPMDRGEGLYRLIEGSLATDWDFPWEKLRLPVLSMTGLHDRVFYVAADVEALAARIAGLQRVEFADAGHLVPLERPREFSAALLAFARRLQ